MVGLQEPNGCNHGGDEQEPNGCNHASVAVPDAVLVVKE